MKITAVMMVDSIEKSLPFWVDRMGFAKTVEVPEGDGLGFVILARDNSELMLQSIESVRKDAPQFAPEHRDPAVGLFIEVDDFADARKRLDGYPIALTERVTSTACAKSASANRTATSWYSRLRNLAGNLICGARQTKCQRKRRHSRLKSARRQQWPLKRWQSGMQNTTAASNLALELQEIHDLLMNGAGEDAIEKIESLVAELKSEGNTTDSGRLIAAHLKAAEVEIEATHLAPAADSVSKAIYVATHESQISLEDPDPQLNV